MNKDEMSIGQKTMKVIPNSWPMPGVVVQKNENWFQVYWDDGSITTSMYDIDCGVELISEIEAKNFFPDRLYSWPVCPPDLQSGIVKTIYPTWRVNPEEDYDDIKPYMHSVYGKIRVTRIAVATACLLFVGIAGWKISHNDVVVMFGYVCLVMGIAWQIFYERTNP
jgi:hypothetical protein